MKLSWNHFGVAGLVLGLVFCLLLTWGVLIEPRLIEVKDETGVVPGLPNEWQGKRLALIADLQVGMWFGNEETVRRIVRRIIAEKPAAVLIAGDFVYHPIDQNERGEVEKDEAGDFVEEVDAAAALVKPLTEASILVYAVLGNHDYGMGYPDSIKNQRLADAVRQKLEALGVAVLANTARPLRLPNAPAGAEPSPASTLHLVGIGSRYARNDRPEIALAGVPSGAPRIVLMHNPGSFAACPHKPPRWLSRGIPTAARSASLSPGTGRGWRCSQAKPSTPMAGSTATDRRAIGSTSIAESDSAVSRSGSIAGPSSLFSPCTRRTNDNAASA